MPTRDYYPGIGQAVADRTINRDDERWRDVANRVALGNTSLVQDCKDFKRLERHLQQASILMSGRHLQHGDERQSKRPIEVFTNCSTAMTRAECFYLLLNGSGVGSSYDDELHLVDWKNLPNVHLKLESEHPDYDDRWGNNPLDYDMSYQVQDSREGWAYAVAWLEMLTYQGVNRNKTVVLDFSKVRPKGSPIGGMQDRPSSGPVPLMEALEKVLKVKDTDWPLWRQSLQIDHHLAECVLVGGARRSARIAVKYWQDEDIFDFISCKKGGDLWSANNSVGVDNRFYKLVAEGDERATQVFDAVMKAQYHDGTGEPGFLNLELLQKGETRPTIDQIIGVGHKFEPMWGFQFYRRQLAAQIQNVRYWMIANPCGEIRLSLSGGYCVIADLAPVHTKNVKDFKEAARLATRALIRVNLMEGYYSSEIKRTNRIGVGLTGIFEYAAKFFNLDFRDLIEPNDCHLITDGNYNFFHAPSEKAMPFWQTLEQVALEITKEAKSYCEELGVEVPVTLRTIKPAGTTSKLFGLTEGAHLPAMRQYLRWVQFRSDDPVLQDYRTQGYPVRELETYSGTTVVGFPTKLPYADLIDEDRFVTASEATPEEQFRWIRLIETYWLGCVEGNQVSYTLKYDPDVVPYDEFRDLMIENLPKVRAVSVMPFVDMTAYEYQPEEVISADRFNQLMRQISGNLFEDVDKVHVDCLGGACPIDFNK